jgi:hypothetical protein
MKVRFLLTVAAAAALAGPAAGQQRRANMVGGGNQNGGRCVAEIVVDGAAELEVNGETGNLKNISGGAPQWRRFECTSPIPPNADIRVNSNGRGQAQLVSTPRNGGPAVVRIEDSEGGAGVYELQLTWTVGNGVQGRDTGPVPPGRNAERGRFGRQGGGRFGPDQAIQMCRDAIRQEAVSRFGTGDVDFRRINVDDNPGRNDWVVGTIGVRRGGTDEQFPFSCSVNLDNGRVREARIEGGGAGRAGYAGRDGQARQMEACRAAVLDKIGERVEFGAMELDRQSGDIVRGTAQSRGRNYEFSCALNGNTGDVRNVDVRIR